MGYCYVWPSRVVSMRLFLDVFTNQTPSYALHGCNFGSLEDANQMAEPIAIDLASSENNDWIGSQVKIRNARGKTLFRVPALIAT